MTNREHILTISSRITTSLLLVFLVSVASISAQRVAIVIPQTSAFDADYSQRLSESIRPPVRVLDSSQSEAAFRSVEIRDVFNMSLEEAKAAGAVVGCDYFVIIRTGTQRRSSFSRADYYEAFAVHYLVSSRTGELLSWSLKTVEAGDPDKARRELAAAVPMTAKEIVEKLKSVGSSERRAAVRIQIEEVPEADTAAATDLKPPIPYRRLKPEYTTTAFLYDVRATIDIEADIDATGQVLATHIVRWAGYGLDESVEKAVRGMNWRPAMRSGKPLPMRVLLRYNFTKAEDQAELLSR